MRDKHAPKESEARPQDEAVPDVEALQRQVAEANDQYLRAVAEFENTRKRLQREKDEFVKYAAEGLIRELLPVLDSLSLALVAVDKQSDPQAVVKGVHLIYRQLLGLLEKEGIKRIPTIEERFDPHLHEAVGHVPAADGQQEGTIVEEVQVGYTMNGKVIRPAMVKIASARLETGDQRPETQAEQPEAGGAA